MYKGLLTEKDKNSLNNRSIKIKELQDKGICFGCYNFENGDIFPNDGLIFYEDEFVRCQFEKYLRVVGQTIIVSREHYEDISEMPIDLGTYILKISNAIIKLHKEYLKAEKVYMCTICDGKRNHLHFQLFPRLEKQSIGYENFVKDEGVLMNYKEVVDLYKQKLPELLK